MKSLLEYLERHEDDIAQGVNDFGDLWSVFLELIGRRPECDQSGKGVD